MPNANFSPQVARILKNMRPQILTLDDFETNANIPNVETCILEYRVPQGQVLWVKSNTLFDFRLASYEKFTLEEDSGGTRTSYQAELTGDIVDEPSYPMDGGDAVAYWNGTLTTVTGIDYTTNKVTCTVTDDAGDLEIYYMAGDGYLRFYAEPPTGVQVVKKMFYNASFKVQYSYSHVDENAIARFTKDIFLPQKWLFRIYANTPNNLSFDAEATNNFIRIPVFFIDMKVLDQATLIKLTQV